MIADVTGALAPQQLPGSRQDRCTTLRGILEVDPGAGREAAAARSEVLEAQARATEDEAEKTAHQAAALACAESASCANIAFGVLWVTTSSSVSPAVAA